MKVGELRHLGKDENPEFEGSISTLVLDVLFRLVINIYRRGTKDPTHLIQTTLPSGRSVNIGAAWKRAAVNGPNPGMEFLSLLFDDPSLPHTINVAAFPGDTPGTWDIMFRRRPSKTAA